MTMSIGPNPVTRAAAVRRRQWASLTAAALTLMVWLSPSARAQAPVLPYDRIEEDWELVIGEPDPDSHAPQIINVISPTADLETDYAVLELNHSTQPDYVEGGMQLQLWSDEVYRRNSTPQDSTLLAVPGEKICYTLKLTINAGFLRFRVVDGTSTTWGEFGGDSFSVACLARVSDLSQYSPALSTSKSRVAFAGHRVEKFSLKAVRYYVNGELVKVDETYRQVHPPVE